MGKAKDDASKSASTFGNIVMPETLDDHGKEAWARYIDPAWWLDASREATAIAFVELWSQFRADPKGFQASKHQQLRSYMAELGLTDERKRFGVGRDKTGDEFFDEDD